MTKKILLTGGNGFIGKNIQESFLSEKYQLVAPRSFELNLADTASVDAYFKEHRFDAVIHGALKPSHRNAKDPTQIFYTNIRMFENLLRHTDKFGKLINLGSGAVYDVAADNRLVKEEQIGQNCGKDDHSFCKYVQHQRLAHIPNAVDLNIFGIFGKYEDWEIRFISNAICKTLFDLPITLRQNRRFSYLYVKDLMPVLEYFIENTPRYKSYNVTPDEETELLSAAQAVQRLWKKENKILVAKDGYGLNYSGDNARLRAEMPQLSFTPFEQAVQELFDYYQSRQTQLDKNLLLKDK
ncbi:MAG: NAD-dependent epimerase/dehydratase family protein [Elusimicrobiaceae bacterium]|nr:NAD-dependent epimerase/dehydratase family protein [Elusimicrobiaceae bacterium]